MSKENYKNVTELTGFRSPSEQEQIGRYMQRKYQRSIKFDKVMGISCVIVILRRYRCNCRSSRFFDCWLS